MHKLTHAILLPFHIKNLNRLNGHELIEKIKKNIEGTIEGTIKLFLLFKKHP